MTKFKLNNRHYKIPKRYTLEQWKHIVRLDREEAYSWPIMMGIAFNQPAGRFINVDDDSLILANSLILSNLAKRRVCKYRDFTEFTLGEFIDLDIWLTLSPEKYIDDILGILSKKPIKYADEALYLIDEYMKFRTSTYRSYAGLFGINDRNEELVDDEPIQDPNGVAKGWYKVLVDLSDNNVHILDQTTDLPLYKALTFMSLRKERMLEEQQRQLNQKRKHDLSRSRK